ncbi:MAG: phenylacetic acid degradation operon negative regulatory protein PaaX [Casimicrobiaceae bacterium]
MRSPASPASSSPQPDPHVTRWIARELAAAPPRAPSLVITVWGDSIAPHGGAVMLPGLIRLLAPFGVNERLTRTSIFRLAREHWLSARRIGRRSLYRLTSSGARRFEQAYRRIYAPPADVWDDDWELVIAGGLPARRRLALRDELHWDGFGVLAPGVYARPAQAGNAVSTSLAAQGGRVIVLRARDDAALRAAVPRAWDLTRIAADYRKFLRRFGAVIERFRRASPDDYDPQQCFVVRTLLIHEYRRVLLRDPRLPAALLPLDWPGAAAFGLCRDFYRLTHQSAERHLAAVLEGPKGALPPANAAFYQRFGGLNALD